MSTNLPEEGLFSPRGRYLEQAVAGGIGVRVFINFVDFCILMLKFSLLLIYFYYYCLLW